MNEMTPRERIAAAISLEPVDRVPVIPKLDLFPFRYRNLKMADVLRDADLFRDAVERTYDDMGGGDAVYLGSQVVTELGFAPMGAAARLPGFQLGDDEVWQMDEKEVLRDEEYNLIIEKGWAAYLEAVYPRLGYSVPAGKVAQRMQQAADQTIKDLRRWEERDTAVYFGLACPSAFELLTYTRSLRATLMDILRRPDTLLAAIRRMAAEQLEVTKVQLEKLRASTKYGTIVALIGANRASFLRPEHFERYFWPFLADSVDALIGLGVTPHLHFDGDWTRYLEYLLKLPPAKIVLDLDGSTDIVKAKQILKGHMCIMGDVPASVFSLGDRDDVITYCRNLIDIVGEGSGFILSSGCSVPLDARPENVRALVTTARSHVPKG